MAIPEQPDWVELRSGAWKRICPGFPVNELLESAARGDQESAVVALDQSLHKVWHRIEFRRTRFPSPQPGRRSRPEIAPAVVMQGEHLVSETAILSIAPGFATLNRAESSGSGPIPADPYRSFTILKKRGDALSS